MARKRSLAALCVLLIASLTNACSSSLVPFIGKIAGSGDPALNPVSDFPLSPGSYWVYSHIEYVGEEIEAGRFKVTVVGNQRLGSYFLAQMKVENSFDPQWAPVGLGAGATDFWYAIDELGRVYFLRDLPKAEELENYSPAYKFPLATMECVPGFLCENYPISEGSHIIETPAGVFRDCYKIITYFLSGSPVDWVCNGLGFAAGRYEHYSTGRGYETTLLEYWIAPP
jgi:hypothetical protein